MPGLGLPSEVARTSRGRREHAAQHNQPMGSIWLRKSLQCLCYRAGFIRRSAGRASKFRDLVSSVRVAIFTEARLIALFDRAETQRILLPKPGGALSQEEYGCVCVSLLALRPNGHVSVCCPQPRPKFIAQPGLLSRIQVERCARSLWRASSLWRACDVHAYFLASTCNLEFELCQLLDLKAPQNVHVCQPQPSNMVNDV